MNDIATIKRHDITNFEPAKKTATRIAALDAGRKHAQRIKDWDALHEAVVAEIAAQKDFVQWWGQTVGVRESPGRGGIKSMSGLTSISAAQAEDETKIKPKQVSRWRKHLKDEDKYKALLFGASWKKAMADKGQTDLRGASGTGENEWYTPDEYLQLARHVLGDIDLDPASSESAQKIVQAQSFYTKEQNGLLREWHGNVWLNPPYAQPLIAEFVSKMVSEYKAGRVTSAIMLTHNYTDTAWFHESMTQAGAVCFTRGRVKFYDAEGTVAAPTQGQAFAYFGNDVDVFIEAFRGVGFVVIPGRA